MRKRASLKNTPSEDLIATSLLNLLGQMRFSDVTVTAICRNAQVSRQTFYRYYDTSTDVLEQYLYNLAIRYAATHVPSPTDAAGNIRKLFAELPFSRELLKILAANGLFPLLERSCCRAWPLIVHAIKASSEGDYADMRPYLDHYVSSMIAMVLQIWTNRDFAECPAELASFTIDLLSGTWTHGASSL